jgi:hypothetical protein
MRRPLKFPLKYEKGIRLITRKGTAKEAEKPFREFLAHKIRETEVARGRYRAAALDTIVAQFVEETIEVLQEKGFDEDYLEMCRRGYAEMPRRAPRKRPKKEFDAKGLPKMPKTPENRAIMREFIRIRQQNLDQKSASSELKVPKTG